MFRISPPIACLRITATAACVTLIWPFTSTSYNRSQSLSVCSSIGLERTYLLHGTRGSDEVENEADTWIAENVVSAIDISGHRDHSHSHSNSHSNSNGITQVKNEQIVTANRKEDRNIEDGIINPGWSDRTDSYAPSTAELSDVIMIAEDEFVCLADKTVCPKVDDDVICRMMHVDTLAYTGERV